MIENFENFEVGTAVITREKTAYPSPPRRAAFTLIELLVVIGIIGILTGLLLPAVQAVRESGRRTTCTNNLRQVALAVLNFESSYKRLPAGITPPTATPYRSLSWLTQILPFADQGPLWDQAREDYAYDPSPYLSHLGMRTPVSLFACPRTPIPVKRTTPTSTGSWRTPTTWVSTAPTI